MSKFANRSISFNVSISFVQLCHVKWMWSRIWELEGFGNKIAFIFKGPGWEPGKPRLGLIEDVPDVRMQFFVQSLTEEFEKCRLFVWFLKSLDVGRLVWKKLSYGVEKRNSLLRFLRSYFFIYMSLLCSCMKTKVQCFCSQT